MIIVESFEFSGVVPPLWMNVCSNLDSSNIYPTLVQLTISGEIKKTPLIEVSLYISMCK